MATIFPIPTNMTQLVELLPFTNTITEGYLGVLILLVIFFGSLAISAAFSFKDNFIAATFITMIVAFPLKYLNMINNYFFWATFGIFVLALIVGITAGSKGGA